MNIDEIIGYVSGLDDGMLTLRPRAGDGTPEIAWGDAFFYYSPDGGVPANVQPFATIVTKDYPDDTSSRLDRPDAFRLNISVSKDDFTRLLGHAPRDTGPAGDTGAADTVFAHPVYGTAGWVSIVNPGPRTDETARELLAAAYRTARSRYGNRAAR